MASKTILVVVSGGIAEAVDATVPKDYEVEIIDYDNLKADFDNEFAALSLDAQRYVREQEDSQHG